MSPIGSKEWEKYNRELKILKAKQKAGGLLRAELERLAWLEERFGEAGEHTRIQVDDPTSTGPTTKTTQDHYATDVSQDLLEQAQKFTPKKEWERDAPKPEAKFEATDPRQGQATFQQEGLSPFAIDLTEDLRDQGFDDDEQHEPTQPAIQTAVDIDDPATLLNQTSQPLNGQNPFAVALDEDFEASLAQVGDEESVVAEGGAKSFEAQLEEPWEQAIIKAPKPDQSLQSQAQDLVSQATQDPLLEQDQESMGEATTHQVDEADNTLDFGLIRQALEYAEEHNLVDEAQSAYAVDEQGQEVEDHADSPAIHPPSADLPEEAEDDFVILDSGEFEHIESSEIKSPDSTPTPLEPTSPEPETEPLPIDELDQIPDLMPDFHAEHQTRLPDRQKDDLIPALEDEIASDSAEFEVPLWIEPDPPGGQHTVQPAEQDREPTQPSPAPPESDQLSDHGEAKDPKRDLFDHRYQTQEESTLPALGLPSSEEEEIETPPPAQPSQAAKAPSSRRSDELMASLFDNRADQSPSFDELFGESQPKQPTEPVIKKTETTDVIRHKKPRKENQLQGSRRVTVHFKDGVNRRGIMRDLDPTATHFQLEPRPNTNDQPERFGALAIKAIFVMLPRGNSYPAKTGTLCKITLIDGRSLEGYTDDYDPSQTACTLLPQTDRGNIERVLVFLDAIKNIYFE